MTTPQPRARNVRAILIRQQAGSPKPELALPAILRSPFLILLWTLTLTTVAAALLLGRIRIPRAAHGLVVTAPTTGDSLTSVLLLPAWSRDFVHAGTVASVDTGGTQRVTFTVAAIDATPLSLASAERWLDAPLASVDTTMVVARLERCTRPTCPRLAPGTRFAAIAQLGTRSLASLALPST